MPKKVVSSLFCGGGGSGYGGFSWLIFLEDWLLPLEKISDDGLVRSLERERDEKMVVIVVAVAAFFLRGL